MPQCARGQLLPAVPQFSSFYTQSAGHRQSELSGEQSSQCTEGAQRRTRGTTAGSMCGMLVGSRAVAAGPLRLGHVLAIRRSLCRAIAAGEPSRGCPLHWCLDNDVAKRHPRVVTRSSAAGGTEPVPTAAQAALLLPSQPEAVMFRTRPGRKCECMFTHAARPDKQLRAAFT